MKTNVPSPNIIPPNQYNEEVIQYLRRLTKAVEELAEKVQRLERDSQ